MKLALTFYEKFPPDYVNNLITDEQKQEEKAAQSSGTPNGHGGPGGAPPKRHLFSANSPCLRYEMEKMYLTNKKLIVYEEASKGATFAPRFSLGVTFLSIVGIAMLGYSMYQRSQAMGE